jgi:hypothetical protein
MRPVEIARLFRVWTPGERCVSIMPIFYAVSGIEVERGSLGTVLGNDRSAVLLIRWDGIPEVCPTAPDCVDPLPKGQA